MTTATLRQEALSLVSTLSDSDLRVVIRIIRDLPQISDDELLAVKIHSHLDKLSSTGYEDYTTPGIPMTAKDLQNMRERAHQQATAGEYMTLPQQEAALADIFS